MYSRGSRPVAYALAVLLAYCVVAGALGVSVVFAAFLAGFAVVHKEAETVRGGARRDRKSVIRVFHSGVLCVSGIENSIWFAGCRSG